MNKVLKVLIVDDSQDDIFLIKHELKKIDFNLEFKEVCTKPDFLLALENFCPDIILSDFSMPQFNGRSALHIANERTPETPFIFVSGTIGEERAIEVMKEGATDYVIKERIGSLVTKFKRALRESEEKKNKIITEKNLRKSERLLKDAQSLGRIGNFEINLNTGKSEWSDEMFRILGYTPHLVIPSSDLIMSLIHPDDLKMSFNEFLKNLDPEESYTFNFRIFRNDNKEVRWLFSKMRLSLLKNEPNSVLRGIIQDVTEQKETEKKLEQSNKVLRTFIYRSSHDLRSPISSSLGLCNVAEMEVKDQQAQNYIGMIKSSLNKLDSIICTLTGVMSINEKKPKIELIDFSEIIKEIVAGFNFFPKYKNQFDLECSGQEEILYSDRTFIISIFQNLFENSLKYRNPLIRAKVKIDIQKDKSGVKINFSDNGIGIQKDIQKDIFNMFFRGHENIQGSGLGLYIVKASIERLGGTINLSSTPGKGTHFECYLPQLDIESPYKTS